MPEPKLILASASPRRAELLRAAGLTFDVIVSPADEPDRKPAGIPTLLWPMCLAYLKAAAVRGTLQGGKAAAKKVKVQGRTILAADTIVVAGDGAREKILNKASDRAHARRMLSLLNGRRHRVITGCCLMQSAGGGRVRLFSAEAICRLKLTPRELDAYVDSGLWRGKAGAYGIQDRADPFVELLTGDFSTVVGLPVKLVQSELACFAED